MTPRTDNEERLKNLAEYAAKFLRLEIHSKFIFYPKPLNEIFCLGNLDNTFPRKKAPGIFFRDDLASPILMHMAKREMEKRELHWYSSWKLDNQNKKDIYFFQVITDSPHLIMETHENEFIAFWTAIEQAIGDSK